MQFVKVLLKHMGQGEVKTIGGSLEKKPLGLAPGRPLGQRQWKKLHVLKGKSPRPPYSFSPAYPHQKQPQYLGVQ